MTTVHVIDDEEQICRLVSMALNADGYEVVTHGSAEHYEASIEGEPQPHVLVVDKNLPGINGLELVARLRQEGVRFEAIMITGYADEASEAEANRLGFFLYLRKPFILAELRKAVAGAAAQLAAEAG
jgi:DNA-binding NtrC family response regulator